MLDSSQFRHILRRIALAWGVGCIIALAFGILGISDMAVHRIFRISIASGFLGFAAILPFSSSAARRLGGAPAVELLNGELGLFVAFSIGMGIRITGTVALFLACRYQMVAPDGEIAAFVLTWYLYLTLIEIALVLFQSKRESNSLDCDASRRGNVGVIEQADAVENKTFELYSSRRSDTDCRGAESVVGSCEA